MSKLNMEKGKERISTNCRLFIKRILRRIYYRHTIYFFLFLFLGLYIVILVPAILLAESRSDVLWQTLPAAFGEIELDLGKKGATVALVVIACLFLNLFIFGIILAMLTNYFVKLSSRGAIKPKVEYNDHVVICGWNYQGNDIIKSLQSSDNFSKKQIAVLADYEKRPVESEEVDFLTGSPLNEEDLKRAGVDKAHSVIILTDIGGEKSSNPDANAFMITTLIRKTINSDAHISVQLLSSRKEEFLVDAGANTIVCLDKLGGSILAYSAQYHGILKIFKELLFNEGCNFYKQEIPVRCIEGKYNFRELGKQLFDKKMIPVAIETKNDEEFRREGGKEFYQEFITSLGEKKVLIVNPQAEYKLKRDDSLFIISRGPLDVVEANFKQKICKKRR